MQAQKPILLGYWNLVGQGNPIRYLLEITKLPYTEKRYSVEDYSEWFQKDKPNLKTNFPNLPYINDNGFILTEGQAVARYLAEKADINLLGGTDIKQKALVNQLINSTWEIFQKTALLCYNQDFDKLRDTHFEKNFKQKLQNMSTQLENKKFLTGDQITLADIYFYDHIIKLFFLYPKEMEEFPTLKVFKTTFESIPEIQAYQKSDKFIKAPFFASFAKWDIKPEDYNI